MKNVLDYLTWEHVELGVRITGCDKSFKGSMVIPDHINGVAVVEIGEEAFASCWSLKSVEIPGTVESVGWKAFADCGLEELHLRAGIKKIEDCAFLRCSSLKSVEIPGSVEVVGEYAFNGCDGLEELRLGAGIKKIENSAFGRCSSLRRVFLPSTIEELESYAFDESVAVITNEGVLASRKVGLREHGSFYSDASLEKPEDALKYLKWENTKKGVRITGCNIAFEGTMTIPSCINGIAVVEIGEGAFYHCRSIKSVEIPGSVEVVGEYAFNACDGLEELRLGAGIKKIEKRAFCICRSLKSVEIPGSVEVVGEEAFEGCDGLEELRLGSGIKKIEDSAFYECGSLKRVDIPGSVESVGECAFCECSELEELHLRAGIKKIEDSAFASCESLKSVEIPDTVESVGEGAFAHCFGLEELRLGTGIKEIGKDAFDPHVTLVVDAGSYAREWCIEHHPDYDVC